MYLDQQNYNPEQVYNDISKYLSLTIVQNHIWSQFVKISDEKDIILFPLFVGVINKIIPDIHNDELASLRMFLFVNDQTTLDDLAKAMQIPENQRETAYKNKIEARLQLRSLEKEEVKKQQTQLEQDIERLFDIADQNRNGWLDHSELNQALIGIGINLSPYFFNQYFAIFDKNQDEKITYQEFEFVLKDLILREILNIDQFIEQIRQEGKLITNPNSRELDIHQMRQVLQKLAINMDNDEILALFNDIDKDKSNTVDMDELIFFLQRPPGQLPQSAQKLLLRSSSSNMSLQNIRQLFSSLPHNFINSFLRLQNRKQQNLPTIVFKPKLHPSGLFYDDLQLVKAQKYNLKEPLIEKQLELKKRQFEIKILKIEGIPIPDENQCSWDLIKRREIGICYYDKKNQKFIGNTIYITADINLNDPDKFKNIILIIFFRWLIKQNNSLILQQNLENFDQDDLHELIFEFIIYIKQGNKLSEISVCFARVFLLKFKASEKVVLFMTGGTPEQNLQINPNDINIGKGLLKNLKKQQKVPQIELQVLAISDVKLTNDLSVFPSSFLIHKNWVNIMKVFREYIAYKSLCRGEFDPLLANNHTVKAFLNLMNTPDNHFIICQWWDDNIEKKKLSYENQISIFQTLCESVFLMLERLDFKFLQGNPTERVEYNPELKKLREICIQDMFNDIGSLLDKSKIILKKSESYFEVEPMNLNEIIGNDEDDEDIFNKITSRKIIYQ